MESVNLYYIAFGTLKLFEIKLYGEYLYTLHTIERYDEIYKVYDYKFYIRIYKLNTDSYTLHREFTFLSKNSDYDFIVTNGYITFTKSLDDMIMQYDIEKDKMNYYPHCENFIKSLVKCKNILHNCDYNKNKNELTYLINDKEYIISNIYSYYDPICVLTPQNYLIVLVYDCYSYDKHYEGYYVIVIKDNEEICVKQLDYKDNNRLKKCIDYKIWPTSDNNLMIFYG